MCLLFIYELLLGDYLCFVDIISKIKNLNLFNNVNVIKICKCII